MAYRADIEIAVKGAQELKRLQDQVSATSKLVDGLNNYLENIGSGGVVRSIQNLRNVVSEAASAFNQAALGTEEATRAARNYIAATDSLNAGLAERLALLKSITEETRVQNLAANNATTITRVANAGPLGVKGQLSTRLQEFLANKQSAQIARENSAATLQAERGTSKTFELFPGGQYSTAKQRTVLNEIASIQNSVAEAVARTGRSQRQLEIASIGTAKSTAQRVQISTTQNKIDEQSVAIARARNLELAKELGIEVNIGKAAANKNKTRGGGLGKGAANALSNAAVGGAFPLLFGQSGAAAAGGAIGGIAGSLIPGIGGFGGSLIGTILGEKLGQGNQVKQLGEDIGFSAEQTKLLGIAFQQAGRDFDKFQQSVSTIQGLSLSIEDQAKAIQLASSLTESYGGKIDKVTDAFAKALSTGKVTQGTLDQLTRQNIEIQQALADKYKISRSELLTYAKEGKISVQDLIDTLVEIGNKGQASAVQQSTAFETAYKKIETAVNNLKPIFESLFKFISDQLSNTFDEVSNTLTNILTGIETFANVVGPVFQQLSLTISRSLASIKIPPWLASFTRETATSTLLNAVPGGAGLNFLRQVGKDTRQNATKGRYTTPDQQTKPKDSLDSFSVLGQLPPSGGSNGAADKAAKAAEREAERVAKVVRAQQLSTLELQKQKDFRDKIFAAETAEDAMLVRRLQGEQQLAEWGIKTAELLEKEKNTEAQLAIVKTQQAAKQLIVQATAQDMAKVEKDRLKVYTDTLTDLQYELDLKMATTEEARTQLRIAYEMAKLKGFKPEEIDAIKAKKQEIAAPKTDRQTIEGRVGQLQDEIKEMTKFSTIAITAADGIGTAFGNSFKSLIDGSMSAREALSSFFKDVASMFLDMAAQIIAKQMTMIILQTILKALGAVAGASGGGGFGAGGNSFNANGALPAGTGNIPSLGSSYGFAKGGAFANGITAFASGGIVGSPTLFKFANGGTTQTGLMGEAGPEAIMPLSRGAGGKLGVNASGLREAMGGAPGMGGSPVLSMSFETTRFGDTDYVSRDQLEAAMVQTRKQASADGAKRGMSMTLDRLQQSPQTRSRVGLR